MKTRNNIYTNLTYSPFFVRLEYDDFSVVYIFSSELYQKKFLQRIDTNRDEINKSLSNRFKFKIKVNLLADVSLYHKIEKRGFLIHSNWGLLECKEQVVLDGTRLIEQKSHECEKTLTQK